MNIKSYKNCRMDWFLKHIMKNQLIHLLIYAQIKKTIQLFLFKYKYL